jgi:hypothetical protein
VGRRFRVVATQVNGDPEGSSSVLKQQPFRAVASPVNSDLHGSSLVVKRRPRGRRIRGGRNRGCGTWGWVAATHKGVVARAFF